MAACITYTYIVLLVAVNAIENVYTTSIINPNLSQMSEPTAPAIHNNALLKKCMHNIYSLKNQIYFFTNVTLVPFDIEFSLVSSSF